MSMRRGWVKEFRISQDAAASSFPALAANGTNCLVTWSDANANRYGMRFSADTKLLDDAPFPVSSTPGTEAGVALTAVGPDYFAVWQDSRLLGLPPANSTARGARITAEGTVLDTAGLQLNVSGSQGASPAVAATGSQVLAVWSDSNALYRTATTRVASNGAEYLVVWKTSSAYSLSSRPELLAMRINAGGSPIDNQIIRIARKTEFNPYASSDWLFPDVASDGEGYLVVWQDPQAVFRVQNLPFWEFRIRGARLDRSGALTTTSPLQISSRESSQGSPRVAANRSGYLVVWEDARDEISNALDVYGRFVSSTGMASETGDIAISTGLSDQYRPAVARATKGVSSWFTRDSVPRRTV